MSPHMYFTKSQKKKAKRDFKNYKTKHVFAWRSGRDKVIAAILSSKPTFELKVSLI